jgi:hypothetical protein
MTTTALEILAPKFSNPRPPRKDPLYSPPADYLAYQARFDLKVATPDSDPFEDADYFNYCRPWLGPLRSGQYFFHVRGVKVPIHRFAYRLMVGEIPDTHVARPICNVDSCVNHLHLLLRPRSAGGHAGSLYTELDAKAIDDIRWLFHDELTPFTAQRLAEIFCITTQRVYQIVKDRPR